MKLSITLCTITIGTCLVSAAPNAITKPAVGQSFNLTATVDRPTAEEFVVTWTPAPNNEIPRVHLYLREGGAGNIQNVVPLAVNVPNTGSFVWNTAPFANVRDMPPGPDQVGQDVSYQVEWKKVATSSAYSLEIVPAVDYTAMSSEAERITAAASARDNTNYSPYFTILVHDNEHSFKWDSVYTTTNSIAQSDADRAAAEKAAKEAADLTTQLNGNNSSITITVTGSRISSTSAATATASNTANETTSSTHASTTSSTATSSVTGSVTTVAATATSTSGALAVQSGLTWTAFAAFFGLTIFCFA